MNHLELIKVLTTKSHVIKQQDHDTVAYCEAHSRDSIAQQELLYILPAAHSPRHDTLPPTAELRAATFSLHSHTEQVRFLVSTAVC